ncbi:hypothetical protein KDK95_27650 [Actinospica sp. MGRD01-02]|uniref:Uncharacterized protein n=1 Tax=Actinospica acidithermotolerans TaxID=2828514 RepID=A0A941EJ95_9ACTN|nr:hypothetical protein [Actinospica acidithermotolerans]MBR7830109.1 hypothetical protein [Actinospica acidithermotolerans]
MQDDQLEIGEDQVRNLFETISDGYQPSVDLVPGALAAAGKAMRRRTIGYSLAACAVAAVGCLATALSSSGMLAPTSVPAGSSGSAKGGPPAITRQCTGVYLPWASGSDASFYGKGSNSQRSTICEQDLTTLARLLPGLEISQSTEPYSAAVNEMMPGQVAQLGSGMNPNTPVLNPWQYNVVSHGTPGVLMIEYSRDADGLEFCHPCSMNTPLAHGFTLVDTIKDSTSTSSQAIVGVQLKTPQHENIIVYLSAGSNRGAPEIDLVKLAENPEFTALLAADLDIIGNN